MTTTVEAPPEISGSKKLKISGLPGGCASGDFTLVARAKGASGISATLRGPLGVGGSPVSGSARTRRLKSTSKSTLRVAVAAGKLEAAYYEITLAAAYKGKAKKATIFFQRC